MKINQQLLETALNRIGEYAANMNMRGQPVDGLAIERVCDAVCNAPDGSPFELQAYATIELQLGK